SQLLTEPFFNQMHGLELLLREKHNAPWREILVAEYWAVSGSKLTQGKPNSQLVEKKTGKTLDVL
ncbi:hypothetical protein ACQP3C_28240, partial [Escherichia coli]